MKRTRHIFVIAIAVAFISGCNSGSSSTATKVELKQNEAGYHRLYLNNNEFYVNGAGLEFGNIEALAEYGGNSFRTWLPGSWMMPMLFRGWSL